MRKSLTILLCLSLILTACNAPQNNVTDSVNSSTISSNSSQTEKPVSSSTISNSEESSSIPANSSSSSLAVVSNPTEKPTKNPTELKTVIGLTDAKYDLTAPAKQSWTKAYKTFYKTYLSEQNIEFMGNDKVDVRKDFIYDTFEIGNIKNGEEYLLNFAQNVSSHYDPKGDITLPQIVKNYIYQSNTCGLLNEKGADNYYGEAYFEIGSDAKKAIITDYEKYEVGNYACRTSMTITEGVENQLLYLGFSPATTEAYALNILYYTHGVCFVDGDKIVFLNSGTSRAVTYSDMTSRIKVGKIYTFEELGRDISDNIKNFGTFPTKPPVEHSTPDANPPTGKPVIYLYPQNKLDVSVKLDYPEDFSYTYPAYNNGWSVTAHPDGRLINKSDNREYSYLFWEGSAKIDWDFTKGFVVKASDTEDFLQDKLTALGLNYRERNDFITYWTPKMMNNEYNLITFADVQYEKLAPLTVSPAPDTMLRVHMVYKPCSANTKVEPQTLKNTERTGFTVVEWGGTRA